MPNGRLTSPVPTFVPSSFTKKAGARSSGGASLSLSAPRYKKDQKRFNSYDVQTRSGPSNVWPFFREKIGQNADQLSLMQRPEWLRFLHAINLFFANHTHRSLGTTPISASIRWRLWIFFCFFRTWTDVMLWNGWVGAKLWSMQVRLAEP